MPELIFPISDSTDLSKHVELLSVMAHPNDKIMRDQFKANYASKNKNEPPLVKNNSDLSPEEWEKSKTRTQGKLNKELNLIFLLSGGEPSLYNSQGYQKTMDQHFGNYKNGLLAGRVLQCILAISNSKDEVNGGASVNKAVFLIEHYLKHSATSIRKSWSGFQSVSHFWATFEFWDKQGGPDEWSPFSNTDLFLVQSEGFREFGTNFFSRAQSNPILPPEKIWLPPKNLQCNGDQRTEIKNALSDKHTLSSEMLNILKKYRAPQNLN